MFNVTFDIQVRGLAYCFVGKENTEVRWQKVYANTHNKIREPATNQITGHLQKFEIEHW